MLPKYLSKIIFLLFVLIFISSITNAQIKIGLNGGVNFASHTISGTSSDITLMRKTGFTIGAIAEYPISNNFSVRLNAGYIQRGGKNKILSLGNKENKFFYEYIELSPYITYKVINSKIFAKIIGGLSFGHLINADVNSNGNNFSIKDNLYLFNITSNFGLEIEIPILAKTSLILNGIYSLGLKNISRYGIALKTNDINLNIGFLYGLL
ncbi:MAG TPA: PorT family protein [Ignavibacteria bacterium]|nr:PorT family protein [Ignavibacteria bacterium]